MCTITPRPASGLTNERQPPTRTPAPRRTGTSGRLYEQRSVTAFGIAAHTQLRPCRFAL